MVSLSAFCHENFCTLVRSLSPICNCIYYFRVQVLTHLTLSLLSPTGAFASLQRDLKQERFIITNSDVMPMTSA